MNNLVKSGMTQMIYVVASGIQMQEPGLVTGPLVQPGPPGPFGPPGKVIISDSPPTEYPAVDNQQARPLESGDQWFDSYRVLLYVYYVDAVGPGQWVSVTKTGPQGPEGPAGPPGGIGEAPTDGQTYGRRGSDTSWVPVTAAGAFYS